jgi:hypothetical protein
MAMANVMTLFLMDRHRAFFSQVSVEADNGWFNDAEGSKEENERS